MEELDPVEELDPEERCIIKELYCSRGGNGQGV